MRMGHMGVGHWDHMGIDHHMGHGDGSQGSHGDWSQGHMGHAWGWEDASCPRWRAVFALGVPFTGAVIPIRHSEGFRGRHSDASLLLPSKSVPSPPSHRLYALPRRGNRLACRFHLFFQVRRGRHHRDGRSGEWDQGRHAWPRLWTQVRPLCRWVGGGWM